MRKLSLVLIAALAIFFAGCNKSKSDTPSIADTSAKQTQPADDQSIAATPDDQTDQNAASLEQAPAQDQAAQSQDQSAPDSTASATPDADAANNNSAQLDDTQNSQAQIPGLPDSTAAITPNTPDNSADNSSNPQS